MIVGFNIDSIEANRGEAAQGNLQVKYNPQIKSVEKANVSAIDDDVAKIDFEFTVEYETGSETAATISFVGNVLWRGNVDDIVDEWDEEESLPENIRAPLMNDLYRKCLSQAVGIADTLNLLPPIPTPTIEGN